MHHVMSYCYTPNVIIYKLDETVVVEDVGKQLCYALAIFYKNPFKVDLLWRTYAYKIIWVNTVMHKSIANGF